MDNNKQKGKNRFSRKGKCKDSDASNSELCDEILPEECDRLGGQSKANRVNIVFKSFKEKFKSGKFAIWKVKTKEPDWSSRAVIISEPLYMSLKSSKHNNSFFVQDAMDASNRMENVAQDINYGLNKTYEELGMLTGGYNKLRTYGYYWGPLTRQEAELELHDQPDGSFLLRDSASMRHVYSLSFRSWGQTLHTRIDFVNGVFSICDKEGYSSVVDLVTDALEKSKDAVYCFTRSRSPTDPPYPVRLTTPLSRLTRVQSLKHNCRFVIRQYVNIADINNLELPSTVIEYLKEAYF